MHSSLGFLLPFLALAACTGNVNVGGPQSSPNDSGPPANANGDASGPGGDAGGPAADGGPPAALAQAQSYANGDVACTSDSDCCAVFDSCTNSGLVVGAADRAKVAGLLAEYDKWAQTAGAAGRCTGCIPTPVQVTCTQGKCLGTAAELSLPDGSTVDPTLLQDHCGGVPGARLKNFSGSIFGC